MASLTAGSFSVTGISFAMVSNVAFCCCWAQSNNLTGRGSLCKKGSFVSPRSGTASQRRVLLLDLKLMAESCFLSLENRRSVLLLAETAPQPAEQVQA